MEARVFRFVRRTAVFICFWFDRWPVRFDRIAAAGYKTRNFTVSAPTPQLAKEIGDAAEAWRRQLSIEWLGKEMPPWSKPCPIHAKLREHGAGGATSFVFDRGEVFGWKMNIQGSRERILDSVLPHEVTHTIFASHFRQPLPRWADEGACTTVEHRSEIAKQERNLITVFEDRPRHSVQADVRDEGVSVGRDAAVCPGPFDGAVADREPRPQAFLTFLADGMRDENWERAVHQHYGFNDLPTMQTAWNDWVKQGRPQLTPETSPIGVLASNTRSATTPVRT